MNPFQKAVRFFSEHAGGVVGEAAIRGYHLALAEKIAKERGWNVEWLRDDYVDLSWCKECENDKAPFNHRQAHADETYFAQLWDGSDGTQEILSSLGNIDRPDHNYRRVIEAELALEAINDQGGIDKEKLRRHRYRRLFTPHGMCKTYCVEHERDPEIKPCQ